LVETTNPISVDPVILTTSQLQDYNADLTQQSVAITRSVSECLYGNLETRIDTLHQYYYQIQNGQLYLWDSLQCQALRFSGGHTDLTGGWTYLDLADFPVDAWETRVNPACEPQQSADYQGLAYTFRASRVEVRTVLDSFCLVESIGVFNEYLSAGFMGSAASVQDCQTLQLQSENRQATLKVTAFQWDTQARTMEFTYEGQTCTQEITGITEITSCASPEAGANPLQNSSVQFTLCVMSTGFLP